MAARRAAALFGSLSAVLIVAVLVLLARPPIVDLRGINTQEALADPDVKRAVVAELLGSNPAFFDSHPDPEVGRIYAPNLSDVEFRGARVSTNRWGMRERDYELPKPAGVVRVVLVGDSYVFGQGLDAQHRLGVVLERELRARGTYTGPIEVLHLAVGSWNVIAGAAFVRRQLADLDPDLVVHVIVPNDFDDNAGVRGFGVRADTDPLYPDHTNARVQVRYPVNYLGGSRHNYLNYGLDYESRRRARISGERIVDLARALRARDSSYLLVPCLANFHLAALLPEVAGLTDEEIAHVHMDQMTTPELLLSLADSHWNRVGHERMAHFLYAAIQQRGLIQELGLEPWNLADEEFDEHHARVVDELSRFDPPRPELEPRFASERQVYTGIDSAGHVAPYASLILGRGTGERLVLSGSCLPATSLDGARVRVFVEEVELGSFELRTGTTLEHAWDLPAGLGQAGYVNVRFLADDWIYTGPERRDCKSFQLTDVAIR